MDYVEVEVEFSDLHPWRDILISRMAEKGFESFVETKTTLKSYIPEGNFSTVDLSKLTDLEGVSSVKHNIIQDQNWNAKWEENFDPVFVEKKLVIKAPFHSTEFDAELVLTIQPQMSFGTGHHQTTWLMCLRLFDMELDGKTVLDMGTGTGVLAILAEKRGATDVLAPDIDEWSFRNANENVSLNNCDKIEVVLGDHQTIGNKTFDVVIANINKNVLIEQFSVYSKCVNSSGKLLISGFFTTDQDELIKVAEEHGFIFEETYTKDGWALIEFHA